MLTGVADTGARIGPNAILQLQTLLDLEIGPDLRRALYHRAGIVAPSPDAGMLPEDDVAHLHHALRLFLPDRAASLSRRAGRAVGDYILAHRIPKPVQALMRLLPAPLAQRMLTKAIARHAWTFAGSGRFSVLSQRPLMLSIARNPLVALDESATPQCQWHAGVFERLFGHLVRPGVTVTETRCCACGAPDCRFELTWT